MFEVVLIAHNIRSTYNVGSLLRTCDGLGTQKVYLTGYTPYPKHKNDARLPHLATKIDKEISKTALGAEKTVPWEYQEDIFDVIGHLKAEDFTIAALEQTPKSTSLLDFKAPAKLALIVGREVEGIEAEVLAMTDQTIEIPMHGQKESFNVVIAAAIAIYHCMQFKISKL